MQRIHVGDYVWVGQAGNAVPALVEEVTETLGNGISGKKENVKVRYVASHGKPEFISENFVRLFRPAFSENAAAFLQKPGSAPVLEEIAKTLGWTEGLTQIQDLSLVSPRKHGRSEPCSCTVCHRVIGGTIPCQTCAKVYVHRKCGRVEGSSWTCDSCSSNSVGELELRRAQSDSHELTTSTLLLSRSASEHVSALVPKDRLQPDIVLEKIKEQAKVDDDLYRVIAEKQRHHRSQVFNFEQSKNQLKQAKLADQEYRLAHFRLQEAHLQTLTQIRKELHDQLQAAHVFGFESFKVLQKQTGLMAVEPTAFEQESYRKTQRAVVDKLFAAELRSEVSQPQPQQRPAVRVETRKTLSLGSVMLDPSSPICVLHLLARCMKMVKDVQTKNEMTLPLLSAIVKVAHDATFSRLLGSSTDPTELERLLLQIRHRYCQ